MGAEAAISTVVQLLADLLVQKVNFIRGVEGEVQSLQDEFNRMQAFLIVANKKQAQDAGVRNFISEIREAALDAEHTIEMFEENAGKKRGILQSCLCCLKHLHHLDRIGEQIEGIRSRLDAIDKSRPRYGIPDVRGLEERPAVRPEVEAMRRLAYWEKDKDLVGLEDDVKKLLKPIMDLDKKGLVVAAVEGMGGIGKSTLAREVYNHPSVISGRFNCRGWVVVSSEFTPQETIKQLIVGTAMSDQEKQQQLAKIKELEETMRDESYLESELKRLLYEQLKEKTYFIVLDDVWKKEDWDSLMVAFPNEQDKTSRLLFTTRIKDVAHQCQILHVMKPLDPEPSWELFLKKGLTGNRYGEFPTELLRIGREIVDKCEGLPLSIIVIGGLLAKTQSNVDWEEARKDLNSYLARSKNSASAILELSYRNLSPELKYCFLCLAFFKEDATIPVKRLLSIMVGQGFIQQTGRITAEEMARGNLYELINRNMVQVKDLTLDNQVKSCHLHDSLRDICLEKAEEEIGFNLIGGRRNSLPKPRNLLLQSNDLKSLLNNPDRNKYIHSLFLLNVERDISKIEPSFWKSFQHLKILDLDYVSYLDLQQLPDFLQLLLRLKQLRIHTGYWYLDDVPLPSWLINLKKLERLDMRIIGGVFQNVELKSDSLRHIHSRCISGLMITDSCTNIETLKYISLKDWMRSSIRMMAGCPIRKLGIFINDRDDTSGVRESFDNLENLTKLYLRSSRPIYVPIISHLRNLTKVKLSGKLNSFPSASMFPPSLSHLTLEGSRLGYEDLMEKLSKLPNLLYLKLKKKSYLAITMHVPRDGFPSLRGLLLESMPLLRMDIEEGGMPQLKLLQVERCPFFNFKNVSNKSFEVQNFGVSIK